MLFLGQADYFATVLLVSLNIFLFLDVAFPRAVGLFYVSTVNGRECKNFIHEDDEGVLHPPLDGWLDRIYRVKLGTAKLNG